MQLGTSRSTWASNLLSTSCQSACSKLWFSTYFRPKLIAKPLGRRLQGGMCVLLEWAAHRLARTAKHATTSRQTSTCTSVGADGFAVTIAAVGPTTRKPRHEAPRRTRAHDLRSCVARERLICGRRSTERERNPRHAANLPRKAAAEGCGEDAPLIAPGENFATGHIHPRALGNPSSCEHQSAVFVRTPEPW